MVMSRPRNFLGSAQASRRRAASPDIAQRCMHYKAFTTATRLTKARSGKTFNFERLFGT